LEVGRKIVVGRLEEERGEGEDQGHHFDGMDLENGMPMKAPKASLYTLVECLGVKNFN
jgi:hypothetical protein